MKRFIPLTILAAAFLTTVGWMTMPPARFTMQPESKLWVEGTSTVHDWKCEVGQFDGYLELTSAATEDVGRAGVTVPVQQLECKNGTMNKKALEALKVKAHPTIRYELNQAELQAAGQQGRFDLKTAGRLTIAGTTRDVVFSVKGEKLGDGTFRFTGSVPVKMTDFGVSPPTAMLGTMKTGDAVTVHFEVIAASTNS